MARTINQSGLDLIKLFEGYRNEAYRDTGGVPTVGYGHTAAVKMGQRVTPQQAEDFLRGDLALAEHAVEKYVKVPLTENQFAALVSFAFNCGAEALRTSTLLKLLNEGKYAEAADQLPRWNKDNGKVIDGLTRRRNAERTLFNRKD